MATRATAEWTEATLVQPWSTARSATCFPARHAALGEVLLEVENLSLPGRFDDVSLRVHAGEVLGLGGLSAPAAPRC